MSQNKKNSLAFNTKQLLQDFKKIKFIFYFLINNKPKQTKETALSRKPRVKKWLAFIIVITKTGETVNTVFECLNYYTLQENKILWASSL